MLNALSHPTRSPSPLLAHSATCLHIPRQIITGKLGTTINRAFARQSTNRLRSLSTIQKRRKMSANENPEEKGKHALGQSDGEWHVDIRPTQVLIGVIGGSGLYHVDNLKFVYVIYCLSASRPIAKFALNFFQEACRSRDCA